MHLVPALEDDPRWRRWQRRVAISMAVATVTVWILVVVTVVT